ncbi:ATP-binding protein [Halococcus dombrowskii]|uniref:ATP-binding protein n=1 Tax=Halococcus dombrowskii TaxID=179637 RepID=A0AAV3SLB9_HALDO|nr:ATP-binding protein [Halococcus dombrowskii]UOO94229.1 ATP-binding protein [Halococcus dombrowskii]
MIDFDPFEKPLREVEMDDLDGLAENNISEGMYMEYKRSLPSTQSLAKVIASFANTHGGFFLIGVAEEELTNIASGQIGVNIQENPDPKETVRNIVRDHLNPSPDFATRVIQRDDYKNYALLLMEIPKSRDTPHIHSSGKIYTRTGEGSDPIEATTDRWSVNKLYQRHEEWKNQVDEFCQTSLNLTRGQAGTADDFSDGWPFLELYVVPSTLGEPLCTEILEDIDLFKSILSESGVYLPSFELDDDSSSFEISSGREYNAYRASNDAVVAQSFNIDEYGEINPAMTPESVKFFDDGGLKVLLNVPQTRVPDNPGRSWQLFLQKIGRVGKSFRTVWAVAETKS